MLQFNSQLQSKIKEESIKHSPKECCGFIYFDKITYKFDIFPCYNHAEDPFNNFIISPRDYLACSNLGKITACYHSHCNDNLQFSEIDKANNNTYNILYILYNIKYDKFNFLNPSNSKKNEYIGKPFILGKSDCFTLMQKYAKNEENIDISFPKDFDYPRDLKEVQDLYECNFKNQGFIKLDKSTKLQKSDGLMMMFPAISDKYPTHAAVYLGDGLILHQPFNCFSCVNIYDNFFKKHTSYVLRHRSLNYGTG